MLHSVSHLGQWEEQVTRGPETLSIPKCLFYLRNVISTLEIQTQKSLGTVQTRFHIAEMLQHRQHTVAALYLGGWAE